MKNKWLIAAIIAVILSIAYWSLFINNAWVTYHTYSDLGLYAYSMYFHLHYPQYIGGFQYLVFPDHISPIEFLILPIYAIFPSALTLIYVQMLVLMLTGMLVFFIAKDLLNNEPIAFALCVAYLANPGMHGIILFDYHSEYLIIPLVLLVFYSYMKNNKLMFFISLPLLLLVMEFAPVIALSLGVALLVYEFRYNKGAEESIKKEKLKLLAILIVASIIMIAIYYGIYLALASAYAHNTYPQLPLTLHLFPFYDAQVSTAGTIATGGTGLVIDPQHPFFSATYPLYALLIVFLGFGITLLFIPDIAIILAAPWLLEAFLLGNVDFIDIWYHYFSFVVGGMMIAAILSIHILSQKEKYAKLIKVAPIVIILLSLTFFYYSQVFSYSHNITSLHQQYYFQHDNFQTQITQLNSVAALVPQNASLLTNFFIESHLTQRRYVATFGVTTNMSYWFVPKYILSDFNPNLSDNVYSGAQTQVFSGFLEKFNYTLIAKNGSVELFELRNSS